MTPQVLVYKAAPFLLQINTAYFYSNCVHVCVRVCLTGTETQKHTQPPRGDVSNLLSSPCSQWPVETCADPGRGRLDTLID